MGHNIYIVTRFKYSVELDPVIRDADPAGRPADPASQPAAGTTTVPAAVTATMGSVSIEAADSPRAGSARHTTRASKVSCLLRRPTAVTVAVASMMSPASTGAIGRASCRERV